MFSIGIYVTSRYKNYPEFKETLDEAIKKYLPAGKPSAICTGSFKSNDAGNGMVKRYAFENGIPCSVFETLWHEHLPKTPGKKNNAGVRANAVIVRNSNACIMFFTRTSIKKWDYMSGGCYSFRKLCGQMGRELIPIEVDIYKHVAKEIPQEEIPAEAPVEGGEVPIQGLGGEGRRASEISGGIGVGGGRPISFGGGQELPPTAVSNGPSAGEVPTGDGAVPAEGGGEEGIVLPADSIPKGAVVDIPVDITGDGVPDVSVAGIDTSGDGVPDAQVSPIDSDGNGTVDAVAVTPLKTVAQPSAPQQAQPPAPQESPAPSQPAKPAQTQAPEEEENPQA